ncbi:tetratricopeptide repeat protein [Streptomyces sp. NPDC057557]|uniref:tetratricopeptide repeat protein n=1 Tax=Streptomyces sp. NPDC057557 TaxID=3346167 RepID=UPI0036B61AC6
MRLASDLDQAIAAQRANARAKAMRSVSSGKPVKPLNINNRLISSWEHGHHLPPDEAAFALVRVLIEHARAQGVRPGDRTPGLLDESAWAEWLGAARAQPQSTAGVGGESESSSAVLPPDVLRAAAETNAPAGLNNLPFQTGHFVGRAADLEQLDSALSTTGAAQVVFGLGGVGKSTLAAHWAATRPHGCAPIRWITADSPASIEQGLVGLATALQPALASALTTEALAEFALQWLASHQGWLLILDNVDDPADIAPLLARAPDGRFLITTRRSSRWRGMAIPMCLDVLAPAESRSLLATGTGPRGEGGSDTDGVEELCDELGHLPLAIEQVGAYIAEAGLTPRAYLGLLANLPADMYCQGEEGRAVDQTIARIWHITLERLADTPLAGHVLRTLAWYAPDRIPRTLLDSLGAQPAVHDAVRRLAAYSMITAAPDAVTVHRLVQAVARTPDPNDPHRQPHDISRALGDATAGLAARDLDNGDDPTSWPAWRVLLPHIDAIVDHAPPGTDTESTALVLNQTALFLAEQGFIARSTAYRQRALAARERIFPADHPHTLTSRHNLASAFHAAGDLEKAIPLYESTLEARQRVLPVDHQHTLASRNNLACCYHAAGDLEKAIPLYEQTLQAQERVLPNAHIDTLTSRHNLARAYEMSGNGEKAILLCKQGLRDAERALPIDHPLTLTLHSSLAGAYRAGGHLQKAIHHYKQALTGRERVLPTGHSDTLTSRNNLADAHHAAGSLEEAIRLYEQNLADVEQFLPIDHPAGTQLRFTLAGAYEEANDPKRALALYERVLADTQQFLSDDHPDAHRATSVGDSDP